MLHGVDLLHDFPMTSLGYLKSKRLRGHMSAEDSPGQFFDQPKRKADSKPAFLRQLDAQRFLTLAIPEKSSRQTLPVSFSAH
jgi:hypothetical protein